MALIFINIWDGGITSLGEYTRMGPNTDGHEHASSIFMIIRMLTVVKISLSTTLVSAPLIRHQKTTILELKIADTGRS